MTPPPPVSKSVSFPSSRFPNLPPPRSTSTISHLTTTTAPANEVLVTQPISLPKTSQSVFKQNPGLDAVAAASNINHQSTSSTKPGHHLHGCFRCKEPRAFGTCDGWKRHMKEHETVFLCRHCEDPGTARNPWSYTRKANLVKHLIDIHNMSNSDASAQADTWRKTVKEHEKDFPCRKCEDSDTARNPWSYTRKANMVKHLVDTHKMSRSDASAQADTSRITRERKWFSCGFCVSLFDNIAEQLNHIDTEHFRNLQDISGWNINNVIQGLMQQPGVRPFWQGFFGTGGHRSQDVAWNDSVAEDLQLRLQLGEERANDLAWAAISQVTGGFTNPHTSNSAQSYVAPPMTPIRSPSVDGYPHGGAFPRCEEDDNNGRGKGKPTLPGFTDFMIGVADLARRGN